MTTLALLAATLITPGMTWHMQYSGEIPRDVDAEVVFLDPEFTDGETVGALAAAGKKILCYVDGGTWETYREDAAAFPPELLGKTVEDWPDERWLDIRPAAAERLWPIMEKRLVMAKSAGCHGFYHDWAHAYVMDTGFPLSAADQIAWNRRFVEAGRRLGLSVGLINDLEQIKELEPLYDWAVNEQCHEFSECRYYEPFVKAGKAVFSIEYAGDPDIVCPTLNALGFDAQMKKVELDAWSRPCRYGDVVIDKPEVWRDEDREIKGTLTIRPTGSLTLVGTTLRFASRLDDETAVVIEDGGSLSAVGSRLTSSTLRNWNLEGHGACRIALSRTEATLHTGLRLRDRCELAAMGGSIEEVQVHDDAKLHLSNAASAYIALYLRDGAAEFPNGALASGSGLTRSFDVATSASTTARVEIVDAAVTGFQLDLSGRTEVRVDGGTDVVLALHLSDLDCDGTCVLGGTLTSDRPRSGSFDLRYAGGPAFFYEATILNRLNFYVSGSTSVEVPGPARVIEANVFDTATLRLGPEVELIGHFAQTYDHGRLVLDGVGLVADPDGPPSFTAIDASIIELLGVDALSATQVYAVGAGRVQIDGGDGWDYADLHEVDVVAPGGITRRDGPDRKV